MHQATQLPCASRTTLRQPHRIAQLCARTLIAGAIGHLFFSAGIVGISALPLSAYAASPTPTAFSVRKSYDIPAGGLEGALNRFGREAGILISVQSELMIGLKTQGLKGSYNVQEALPLLLAGTDLTGIIDSATVTVHRAAVSSGATLDTTLPAVTVRSDLTTTTEGTGSYAAGLTSVGGKSAQSLREVPQSVSVVTRQQINDMGFMTMPDALKAMPGVTSFQGSMLADRSLSRGFEIGVDNMRVDGGATLSRGFGVDNDLAFYDHIEVLRGADGLFGGNSEPGGVVNLVRKKPTREKQIIVQAQVGSDNFKRVDLDVSGPLSEDGRIRGRAVLAQENKDFFFDVADSKRTLAYGILEADLTADTTVSIGASYLKRDSSYQGYGLPRAKTGEDLHLPRSTYLSGADDRADKDITSIFGHLSHTFNANWKLDVDANYERSEQDRFDHYFNGAVDLVTGAGNSGAPNFQHEKWRNSSIDASLKGRFDMWGRQHDLVLGGTWSKFDSDAVLSRLNPYTLRAVPNIYQFDPYSYLRPSSGMLPWSTNLESREDMGVYGSVRLHVTDPLHIIAGGRFGTYKYAYKSTRTNASGAVTAVFNTRYEDDSVFTPYLAATYDLNKSWTAYGSIAETFKSQANYRSGPAPGAPLDPVTGRNYELGLKGDHFGGQLHSAFAIYRIDRDDAAVRDTTYPSSSGDLGSTCCFLPKGRIVSKGFDAELSGEVMEGLQLSLSYNYNDNRDKNSTTGARYNGVNPAHMVKAFGSYQLRGAYNKWKLGGGVTMQTKTYVDDYAYLRNPDGSVSSTTAPYRITQGGYAIWSAFGEYKINEKWSALLNINNLFDRTYYSSIGYLDYGSFYGAPRNGMLTLRGKF